MILYLIKSILCSAAFIIVYHLFLENEKMHRFNRFYLLIAIPLTFIVPLLTFKIESSNTLIENLPLLLQDPDVAAPLLENTPITHRESYTLNWPWLLSAAYSIVCILLLLRFLHNLIKIIQTVRLHEVRQADQVKLVIIKERVIPHTFLRYIFINQADAENRQIITHESAHARELHSLDIIFIEFIRCLYWINPILLFYKRAIRLNHEFIADEAVIRSGSSAADYQELLLTKSGDNTHYSLASNLNYSLTKKRFIMMTQTQSLTRSLIKITVCLLLVCSAGWLFSDKAYSQVTDPGKPAATADSLKLVTADMMLEFEILINQYGIVHKKYGNDQIAINQTGLPESERIRMKELYDAMTPEQRTKFPKSIYYVMAPTPKPSRKEPTAEQLTSWKDEKLYGVWLDGNRISSKELARIKPINLGFYSVSKLLKNATHYGQYKYHVELMTDAYFDKTYPQESK